uniref:Uncharacterized protein n=1 Tax=Glossina brevipalpis TaxID=37001 RepID=A0A1A9W2I8_9MUSC
MYAQMITSYHKHFSFLFLLCAKHFTKGSVALNKIRIVVIERSSNALPQNPWRTPSKEELCIFIRQFACGGYCKQLLIKAEVITAKIVVCLKFFIIVQLFMHMWCYTKRYIIHIILNVHDGFE